MEILQKALLCAIKDTLNVSMIEDKIPLKRAFVSKIRLDSRTFYIATNKALLLKFALDFLNEENPSNDTLIDISKEMANIAIGKAKVLYEESGIVLKLGIPEFIGNKIINNYNKCIGYKSQNMRCSIYEI
ncbi:chemotaxis protein CheX [Helicobacter sp. MIT 99-5507]|uniref:chemotaxis protein CheX n=1 Tax=Helicobacter sp. MIT 99-5507 TaxID=152489 RepID=UPI000E1EE0D3|nr:chemotaxis protein CheX [Helicobacter sp. MIT 99-5507]RDU57305.1 hypothetical protein CQA42_04980 [Helicobacter sp. MIT 99-5507]